MPSLFNVLVLLRNDGNDNNDGIFPTIYWGHDYDGPASVGAILISTGGLLDIMTSSKKRLTSDIAG